jgi:RNA polymerase sigma factor (sigma-70 family)
MGLMRAVPGFRPDRGMKFSSYAVMWIKAYIRRQFDLTHFKFEVPEGNHVRRTAGNPARVDDSLSILERAEQVRRAGRALELDPVRRLVMERRLFGGESLQAVGNILGLCRERVRQLERDVVELIRERLPREA